MKNYTPEELADNVIHKTDEDYKLGRGKNWRAILKINIADIIRKDRISGQSKTPNGEEDGRKKMISEGSPVIAGEEGDK